MGLQLKKDCAWSLLVPTSMGVRITPLNGQPVHSSDQYQMYASSAETNVACIASYLGLPVKVLTTFVKDSPIARFIKTNLRGRNMLDSSVASDALANTASGIAGQVGNQALSSYLKGFDVQQGMPGMLSSLANTLGGRGTTATGSNTATGTQTDPMAAYRLAFGYV